MASCVASSSSINAAAVTSLRPGLSLRISRPQLPLPGLVAVKRNSSVCRSGVNRVVVSASHKKELDVTGPTTMALMAALVIPEIAEAAQPGISPSLKNLLLSVVAGGVVALVIGVAVAGVSVFDPVKRK
ncbi:hypothetical protein O6H91_07G007700 [Diphasiastrum complanatum]|uniref:Uncharacterized protein n=1 Tax=Diphasiastrum complanatum TaxID=34168 RepID=A0ACC2D216_DIPCM|nr:hypothetical protein O6H91_07G007700 [Diphasiastrum complanatum]